MECMSAKDASEKKGYLEKTSTNIMFVRACKRCDKNRNGLVIPVDSNKHSDKRMKKG